MSYFNLQRIRFGCVLVGIAIVFAAIGNNASWWRIEPSIASLWWMALALLAAVYFIAGDKLPDALKEQHAEQARRKEHARQKAAEAAALLYQRRTEARQKALAIAQVDYPDHVDDGALGVRGWWQEGDESDIVGRYLEPAEIVLKYEVEGDGDDNELRLYARDRVEAAERSESEVKEQIRENLAARERVRREEEEEREAARRDAEEETLLEQERLELAERKARQKIIRIDDRLK